MHEEKRRAHRKNHRHHTYPIKKSEDKCYRTKHLDKDSRQQRKTDAQSERVGKRFRQSGVCTPFTDAVQQQQRSEQHPQHQQEKREFRRDASREKECKYFRFRHFINFSSQQLAAVKSLKKIFVFSPIYYLSFHPLQVSIN